LGSQSISTAVQYTGAQINFGELNPHLICDSIPSVNAKFSKISLFGPPEKFKALQSVNFTFGVNKNNNILLCSIIRTAFTHRFIDRLSMIRSSVVLTACSHSRLLMYLVQV
jgi:hypothetical protein